MRSKIGTTNANLPKVIPSLNASSLSSSFCSASNASAASWSSSKLFIIHKVWSEDMTLESCAGSASQDQSGSCNWERAERKSADNTRPSEQKPSDKVSLNTYLDSQKTRRRKHFDRRERTSTSTFQPAQTSAMVQHMHGRFGNFEERRLDRRAQLLEVGRPTF